MRSALGAAESFIAGFEGDETQEGIDKLIEQVRDAQKTFTAPKASLEKATDSVEYARLQAERLMHMKISSVYAQLESSGVLTGLSEAALTEIYTLRLVASKAQLLLPADVEVAVRFWQSKLDELNPPDDAHAQRRVDSPRT